VAEAGAIAESTPRAETRRRRLNRGLRFTREGRFFVLVTLGVGAAAVNTGNNLLYLVLGLMLSLILVSGVLSDLVLLRVEGLRHLPARAFVGTPMLVELVLRNEKGRLPSFSLEVEDVAEGARAERRCYFLKVEPSGEQRATYRREAERRGVLRFTSLRISTRYPFGLFDKWRIVSLPGELLVYPRLDRTARAPELAAGLRSGTEQRARGTGTEPAGLREYREGDEARSLHGRRSAALGRLVVREREREASHTLVVSLDNAIPEGEAHEVALERAISRAAGMLVDAHERGASVEVLARGSASPRVPAGAPIDPVLAFLARLSAVRPEGAPPLPRADVRVVPEPERAT
jgi:uncharacterized protein (DUF58 family)